MQKPVVIANPRSGQGLDERSWARIARSLTDGLGPFDVRFTGRRGHATEIARDEARAGRRLVIAFGGDGTINEVAHGLVEAGGAAELGIIPRGTGGDFARTLALPHDVTQAGRRLMARAARPVDLGRVALVASDGRPVERTFVNVASFGFSATVAVRANESSKRLGGRASFLAATVRALASYENADLVISVDDDRPRQRRLLLGAVGNGRYFGGGMKICPDAQLDSGRFELVLIGDYGHWEVLSKVHRLYAGTHATMPHVEVMAAKTLTVAPAGPARVPLEVDGETPGFLPARFTVLPRALRIRF